MSPGIGLPGWSAMVTVMSLVSINYGRFAILSPGPTHEPELIGSD
jgi:hypothetical protein